MDCAHPLALVGQLEGIGSRARSPVSERQRESILNVHTVGFQNSVREYLVYECALALTWERENENTVTTHTCQPNSGSKVVLQGSMLSGFN